VYGGIGHHIGDVTEDQAEVFLKVLLSSELCVVSP
jgi:hypothetical protein